MSLGCGLLRYALKIAVLTATACHVGAASVSAGIFPVTSCNDAAGSADDGWSYARTAPADQFEAITACPTGAPDPYGSLRNGLGVADQVNAWDEGRPDGSYAEWRFTAPQGTAIVAARVTRDIGNRDEWTPYAQVDGRDQVGESCMPGQGEAFCRIQGTRTFGGLDARSIAYGITCVTAPYCAHLWDLRAVWVLILGATVTLDDREAPTVSNLEPVGVAGGGWRNRAGVVSFSASDNTGVRRRRVVVDGVERVVVDAPGAAAGGCGELGRGVAYSYSRPCGDARGLNGTWSVSVDPCPWGDGTRSVRGAATDTGGLGASSPSAATIRVDCSAPVVSVGHARGSLVAGDAVEPVLDASDATSGVGTTAVEASMDGGAWKPHVPPLIAEAGRSYAFRARAADVAGNWSRWSVTPVLTAAAPPPPPPEPQPDPDPAPEPQPQPSPQPATPSEPPADQAPTPGAGPRGLPEDLSPLPHVPPVALLAAEGPPTQKPAPRPLADPRLRITQVRIGRRGTVVVRGTAAGAARGSVRVVLRASRGVRRTRSAQIRSRRWRATFRLRPTSRPLSITATTPQTAGTGAGTARWRARARASANPALAHHPA